MNAVYRHITKWLNLEEEEDIGVIKILVCLTVRKIR